MTHTIRTVILVAGAGALGAQAVAQAHSRRDALLDLRASERIEAAPTGWQQRADGRPLGAPSLDVSGAFGGVARGNLGADGALATLDAAFESLAPLPASLVNQLDVVQWGGTAAGVTGRNHFSAPTTPLAPPQFGAITAALAGNTTQMLRALVTAPGNPGGQYFGRWARYNLYRTNTASPTQVGADRFVFQPTPGQDVRIVHDTYLTSIDSLWTSEPTHVGGGFIVARLLWGGENPTSGIGLPVGTIEHFYTLDPSTCGGFLGCIFAPCGIPQFYRSGAPFPGWNGNDPRNDPTQRVAVPIGGWFKIIHETTAAGQIRHVLDLHDGAGEFVIFEVAPNITGRVDRMAWSGGFDTPDDAMYVDNLRIEGAQVPVLTPPALVCEGGYVDDLEWLGLGAISPQVQNRWTGAGTVVERPAASGNQVIALGGVGSRTVLPLSIASPFAPARACVNIETETVLNDVFLLTLRSNAEDAELSARVLALNDGIYVQIDRNWNHLIFWPPVVGEDVADTGVDWTPGAHDVCVEIDNAGVLRVFLDGVSIYTGEAFVRSFDSMDIEAHASLWLDNVGVDCSALPGVTLPALSLPYHDDLGWGYEGVSLRLHDDDANPQTGFRWGSAANTPIVRDIAGNAGASFALENFERSEATFGNEPPRLATGAGTDIPQIEAAPGVRGWAARTDNVLTDFYSSRTWSPDNPFGPATQLAISGAGGAFWVRQPTPGMTGIHQWVNTGATPQSLGVPTGQWFPVTVRMNLSGQASFRVNGRTLRWATGPNSGQPVLVEPLDYNPIGPARMIKRYGVQAGDERFPASAPPGARSIQYVDNVRAWALPCLGDTNDDGVVNFADLNTVLAFFGQTPPAGTFGSDLPGNIAPDANHDGIPDDDIVNFADLNVVLSGFGVACE